MSNNRIVLDGLDELRQALRAVPQELTDDAAEIVDDAAEVTKSSLIQSYPLGDSGNLRAGVKVATEHTGRFGVSAIVKSTSPHAHLWEFGTENRVTKDGWFRGKMPAHQNEGLVPIAQRNRKRMYEKLIDLVRRAGFEVSGSI